MAERGSKTSETEYEISDVIAQNIHTIAQDIARLAEHKVSADPLQFLTPSQITDTFRSGVLRRLRRIEEYLGMSEEQAEDKVFDFESEEFDGLKALRRMNREADEAISRASVVAEDTQRFLESRKIKPAASI